MIEKSTKCHREKNELVLVRMTEDDGSMRGLEALEYGLRLWNRTELGLLLYSHLKEKGFMWMQQLLAKKFIFEIWSDTYM